MARFAPKFSAISISLSLIFSFGLSEPAQATPPDVYTDFAANDFGLLLASDIYGQDMQGSSRLEDWKQLNCLSWDDPSCLVYDNLAANLILSPCLNESDRACLESVEASSATGVLEKLSLYGEASSKKIAKSTFKAGTNLVDIPAGGGLSVWKSSEKNSDGSDKFFAAHILLQYIATSNRGTPGAEQIVLTEFKGQIFPVTLASGPCKQFKIGIQCVNSANFTGSEKVAVTLRMNKNLTGWIFGRMQSAEFSVTPLDDFYNKIRISGDVTLVPELAARVAKIDIAKDSNLEKYLRNFFTVGSFPGNGAFNDAGVGGRYSTTYAGFLAAQTTTRLYAVNFEKFALFAAFEDQYKPYSPREENNGRNLLRETNSIFWNFGASTYIGNDSCSADKTKLHGLVVTNAPIVENGPPEFKDGSLNYKVAGLHNNIDGSEFKGRYTYIVQSETARCYYRFSKAPIEARVEVVSASGTAQIATVSVSERNGFIKLQADNFTFSAPTIRVSLTQAVATPTPAPAMALPKKNLTITCIKAKTMKKVTGVNPKCPVGYKKK